MEEKKKRFRPTLTAYRALEKEIDELREQNRLLARENKVLTDEVDGLCALRSENRALEQSNALMEQELTRMRSCVATLEKENDSLCEEVYALQHRGLLKRLFNIKD